MDARDILDTNPPKKVLIDTYSLEGMIAEQSRLKRVLRFKESDKFDFYRFPKSHCDHLLSDIELLKVSPVEDRQELAVEYSNGISAVGKIDFPHNRVSNKLEHDISYTAIDLVRIQSALNRVDSEGIFITENVSILQNRAALEKEMGSGIEPQKLNIMSVNESIEFMGLYQRNLDDFSYIPQDSQISKLDRDDTAWYWDLFDLIIKYFDRGDYMSGFRSRFIRFLIGLDEMGYQYYKWNGNITRMYMYYHFSHCVSLITGIFDSLALHTQSKYNLQNYRGDPIRDIDVDLQSGSKFVKSIKNVNRKLYNCIKSRDPFIGLMYLFRPIVIHREGLMNQSVEFHSETFNSHLINLDILSDEDLKKFHQYRDQLDDEQLRLDPITEWGYAVRGLTVHYEDLLNAYQFLKQAASELIDFSNNYLRSLGNPNRYQERTEDNAELKQFEESALYPYLISDSG